MNDSIIEVTDSNFEEKVLKSDLPVLVDFWAAWCAPCRMIAPIVDELAADYQGKLQVAKLNVDENQSTAINYGIMSIPTLGLFKNGKLEKRIVGYMPKEDLASQIDPLLN